MLRTTAKPIRDNRMESHLTEESLWADALAARLRVVQANFADDDAGTRHNFLVEEIERAMKGSLPEKRKAMLEALTGRFPTWHVPEPIQEKKSNPTSSHAETVEESLDRLINIIPVLSSEQREQFVGRLKTAGLVAESSSKAAVEMPPELQKRLHLDGTQSIAPDRVDRAFPILLDLALTLDQLVWTLWKQVAPKSVVRKDSDFGSLTGQYLTCSAEVSTAQVIQSLERTRKLIAGLLGAIGRAGGAYARERARLFDPAAIEAATRPEKKWNESSEFACWRKYVQLCREYGAESTIEKGIQEAVAKAAENLILGRPAS
jgi:hypothetical protein